VDADSGVNPMVPYTFVAKQSGGLESGTLLGLSASSITYGNEKTLKLHVKVTAKFGGAPTGKVGISDGKKTICVVKLSGGKGTCSPASSKLIPIGKYSLVAYYAGNCLASKSTTEKLTVKK
jgi:hypothetical protein